MVGKKTWNDTCETDKAFRGFSVRFFVSIALTRYQVLLSDVIILKNEVLHQSSGVGAIISPHFTGKKTEAQSF